MRALALSVVAGLLLTAGSALAQPYPSMTSERTIALYLQGGLAVGSSDTGAAIGGAFTLDVTDRLGLEAAGGYLDRGPGIDAWTASASVLVYLRPAHEDVVPFLAVGGGLYRSMFDLGYPAFSGTSGGFTRQTRHPGHGPGPGGHVSSTDPVFPLGGGLRWNVSDRLSLRADARALVVAGDGETFTVGLFTVGAGFRF